MSIGNGKFAVVPRIFNFYYASARHFSFFQFKFSLLIYRLSFIFCTFAAAKDEN